nr:toll-like receptor 6 [Leptinotarsa decemlineata]
MWCCRYGMILVLVVTNTSCRNISSCPEICQCNEYVTNCQNNDLSQLPQKIDTNVRSLDLSINNFRNISENLKLFRNLKYLNLSHNKIDTLRSSDFEDMDQLERLDLTFNLFHDWKDIHSQVFTNLVSLVFLDMSNNELGSIPQFSNHFVVNSLQILELNNCSIESVPALAFNNMSSLKELHLSSNPIREINGTFSSSSIRFIDLSNSHLGRIRADIFERVTLLETLLLKNNIKLRKITINSDSLQYIDLTDSSLENIPHSNMNTITTLNLFGNFLRTLENNAFSNYSSLIYLNLSSNAITDIEENCFRGLDNLKVVDLSLNKISLLSEKTFLPTISLVKLDISHNYISTIDTITSTSLNNLDASYCEIYSVVKYSLSNLPKLMHLSLRRNFMTSLPDGWVGDRLVDINLSDCKIKNINNKTFSQMLHLKTLDLTSNQLISINPSYFPKSLRTIRIENNQWRCDCKELKQAFEWFLESGDNGNGLICDTPENVEGETWYSACQKEWHPPKKNDLYWYSLVLITSMALLLVSVTIMRKVNQIKEKRSREEDERRRTQEREAREALERMQRRHREYREEAMRNAPDPRESQGPPSYNDALLLPRIDASHPSLAGSQHSLASRGSHHGSNPEVNKKGKVRRKRRRRRSESLSRVNTEDTDTSGAERPQRPMESDF